MRISNFKRAKAGDKAARQALVCANLRFVVSVARDYKNYGLSLVELVSVGNLGLMEAVKRFDETRGFNFITYAVWWIRQAILKALSEQGKIARPPMSQMSDWRKIDRATNAFAQALGRAPTFDEIVARTDMSAERTRNALKISQQDLALDAPAFPNDETSLAEVSIADQEGVDIRYERTQMAEAVRACLGVLDPRESQIVRAYFGLENTQPRTLEEIGDTMGVTRERVRQLRNRALEKMCRTCGDCLVEFSRN